MSLPKTRSSARVCAPIISSQLGIGGHDVKKKEIKLSLLVGKIWLFNVENVKESKKENL